MLRQQMAELQLRDVQVREGRIRGEPTAVIPSQSIKGRQPVPFLDPQITTFLFGFLGLLALLQPITPHLLCSGFWGLERQRWSERERVLWPSLLLPLSGHPAEEGGGEPAEAALGATSSGS